MLPTPPAAVATPLEEKLAAVEMARDSYAKALLELAEYLGTESKASSERAERWRRDSDVGNGAIPAEALTP